MGRPKGSKNQVKKAIRTIKTTSGKNDVTPESQAGPEAETAQDGSDACGDGGTEHAPAGEAESSPAPTLEEHKAEPPAAPPTVEEIPAMTASLCRLIHDREERREEAKSAAKRAREDIDAYDTEISRLAERIESADLVEDIDHVAGVVTYTSRTTGKIVRTRPLVLADKQQELPFDNASNGWSRAPSFSHLAPGMILEHEGTGYCKVLEVDGDVVVVITDDWVAADDERDTSIARWTKTDWDNWECWPMPVPGPQVGEVWEWADGMEGEILAVDGDWYRVRVATPEPHEMHVPLPAFVMTTRKAQQAEAEE